MSPADFKIPPWEHQLEAIKKASMLPYYAFFFEQGTGKTGTAINTLRFKFNNAGRILRTIIFCPPLVIPNWRDEWKLHTNIDLKKVVPLYGPGKARVKTFIKHAYNNGMVEAAIGPKDNKIFVTNYESLLMEDLFLEFQRWEPECLVFDESHRCKSSTAKRSKLADQLANPWDAKAKRPLTKPLVYLLSGSPVLNNPMDVFQQFLIMDGGEAFGSNFFAFRARFFRDRNAGIPKDRYFPKWEIMTKEKDNFDAEKEIAERIFSRGMRVEKKDCLDLPPEVSVTLKVGMSKEQARLYNEMKSDFITFINSKACTATLSITKALRLMQITSGFISVETQGDEDSKAMVTLAETPKLDALKELLEEICENPKNKVLVWAVWKENYEHIRQTCTALGLRFVEVHGEISEAKKRTNVDLFRSDNAVRVFIGHPGSGGIGINLVEAAYSIFYSRTFSLEHYLQARARNHRGGSKEQGHLSITHYDLVCENTIDELVVKKLANKLDMSDKLLRDLSQEILEQGEIENG